MTAQFHFEVFVQMEGEVVDRIEINAENSATWHEGTVFDVDAEQWTTMDCDDETEACDQIAVSTLADLLDRGPAALLAIDDILDVLNTQAWNADAVEWIVTSIRKRGFEVT